MSLKAGLLAMLLLAGAACVPAASHSNKIPQFDPSKTKMGEIQQKGHIVIGIPSDYYPFGYAGRAGTPRGFTAGLGRLAAAALGVHARYVARPADQLLGLVDRGGADMVFPMIPITQTAVRANLFSDPYYLAHQRLLAPAGSSIQQVSDIGAQMVCSAIDPATEIRLSRLDPQVKLHAVARASQCAAPLRAGKVVAATASDVALLALRHQVPGSQLVGDRLTTEGYGAAVSPCDPGLAQFISRVFATAKRDGDWTALYDKWVRPASGTTYVPSPPTLTVIDAWDLFPPKPGTPSPTPVACAS